MICPKCRAEYVRGITVCAECDVPLEEYLPDDQNSGNAKSAATQDGSFREIFITHNAGEVALIKSLFDDAGFDYYFQGEHFASVYSLAFPARLFVRDDQYEQALEVLSNMDFGLWGYVDEEEE